MNDHSVITLVSVAISICSIVCNFAHGKTNGKCIQEDEHDVQNVFLYVMQQIAHYYNELHMFETSWSRHLCTWWRHQMETFSALLAICAGNSPVPVEFLSQRPVTRSFDVFFDLRWINGWVNNGEGGDLRCRRAHYDVIVNKHLFIKTLQKHKRFNCDANIMPAPCQLGFYCSLIHMAAILQTIFSNAFSSMKNLCVWFKFHWSLFLRF